MMETHKSMFKVMSSVTVIIIATCYFTRNCEGVYQIFLALLGSSAIAAFLEILNFMNARKMLVMQIIADNSIIGNYMSDTLWVYRNTVNPTIKIDTILGLYEKTQNVTFALARERYSAMWSKDGLIETLAENVTVITEIYDLLLECQRLILTSRKEMFVIEYDENTVSEGKSIDSLLDEALILKIDDKVNRLMELEPQLGIFNNTYKTHFKLEGTSGVKSHAEIMNQIAKSIDSVDDEK